MISEIRRDISLTLFLTITVFLGSATDLRSQNQSRPQFEVASIKPNKSGDLRQGISPSPGRLVATNANVKMLVRYAYNAQDWEIVGEPQWLTQDRFDIDAKIAGDSRTQPENIVRAMAQSLLETRFQLKVHHEGREMPVYKLVVAKSGLKMKLSPDQTPVPQSLPGGGQNAGPRGQPGEQRGTISGRGLGTFVGNAVQVTALLRLLAPLGRPIIDATDLKGLYDFTLQFMPEPGQGPPLPPGIAPPSPDPARPSIFTALPEQLGLQLESVKSTVDVLVIDSVQRPSEN